MEVLKGTQKNKSLHFRKPLILKEKIGATGFEPATSRPPAVRATKLRHTPKQIELYQSFYEIAIVFLLFQNFLKDQKTEAV